MRISAFSMIAILAAAAAQAAPPQVVSVDEDLIAIGGPEQLLFILREVKGEVGTPSYRQTDTVLIARSRDTNQDVYTWPIRRTLDNGPDHVETKDNPRVVTLPLEVAYNPWHVSFTHHARYANELKATDDSGIEILRNRDGILITAKTPHFAYGPPKGTPLRTSYWLGYKKLAKLFGYSLMETPYRFPQYYTGEADPVIGAQFNPEQDCKFDYFTELSEQTDGEQQAFWAAKVTCQNNETNTLVSMYVTLQPLP